MHIYCEGEKTEPKYIEDYLDDFFSENRSLKVVRVEPTEKNTPIQLVDEAVTAKETAPPDDLFWVVYDRESCQKYADSLHAAARDRAASHGIGIALSNVCFEVWLLLHFEKSVGPYHDYKDLRRRSPLKKHLPDYEKGDGRLYRKLQGGVAEARRRAECINKRTRDGADPKSRHPHQWNPYTNVYELLDAIDRFAKPGRGK